MNRTVPLVVAVGAGMLVTMGTVAFVHTEKTNAAPAQNTSAAESCSACRALPSSSPLAEAKTGVRLAPTPSQKSVRAERPASAQGSPVGVAVITDLLDQPAARPRLLPTSRAAVRLQAIAEPRSATKPHSVSTRKTATKPAEEVVVKLEIPAKATQQPIAPAVAEPRLLAPLSGEPPKVLLRLSNAD